MTVEARGAVLRRSWFPVLACLVVVVLGVLFIRAETPGWRFGYIAAAIGLFFAPVLFLRNAFPRQTPATFRATANELTIDGKSTIPSEDILEAKILPRGGSEGIVEFALRGRKSLTLRLHDKDAKALVDILGARRTRFRLEVSFGKRFLACFVLLAGSFVIVNGVDATLIPLCISCVGFAVPLGWLVGLVLRGRLVVGADGFTTRWLFRERFIAFRDVAVVVGRVRFASGWVEDTIVNLTSGRRMRLRTIEEPNVDEERGSESHAMLSHLRAAFEKSTPLLDGSVNVPSLVERGSRSAREWLSSIDALVRGGGSRYRVAAVSAEMLADLTNDPSAPIGARVGAAAALVRMGDETHRTRVRIAAEACAKSDLRDTLLALSEARDDGAAEAALASLRADVAR